MVTPHERQDELAEALGVDNLFFKREDLHPYGSHKGRSIPVMIDLAMTQNIHSFAVSSSGNAALAALAHINAYNLTNPDKQAELEIFVGKKISEEKLALLHNRATDKNIKITQVEKPLQALFEASKKPGVKTLRQSTDDSALIGYQTLAEELAALGDISAIFIPTSSGTTAQALGASLQKLLGAATPTQIHIVQTSETHPIAELYDTTATEAEASLAGAIVDKVAHRKSALQKVIDSSGGSGWIVNNAEIQAAIDIVAKHTALHISPNSALAVAGLQKALAHNRNWKGRVICLITGK